VRGSLYLLTVALMFSLACRRLPDVQGNGAPFLQGVWQQDSIAHADRLLNYTEHMFKFTCDSFYIEMTTHSKVNYYEDSCYHNGLWREYAKGTYHVRSDTVFLLGTYTKANYKQKISGCYRIGQYIKGFKILDSRKDSLILESTENQRELRLLLKTPIKCVPQPL